MRLLIVEKKTAASVSGMCEDRTFVTQAEGADDGLSILRHETFDLVLVDVASLHEDGFAFIRRLRSARNDTPLVALTGIHCDDRVRALGLGADDAIAQPIDRDELRARITAVIRRHKGYSQSLLQSGVLCLSIDTREVCISGRPLKLTDKEYSMLELLVLRKNQVVTKEMFLNHLYNGTDEAETKIIDVFICKLRRKLRLAGADGVISTAWGQGYVLRDTDERQRQSDTADNQPGELVAVVQRSVAPPRQSLASDWTKVRPHVQSRWDGLPQARVFGW
jgi:two-component system, cell cycle response regulator CtrA